LNLQWNKTERNLLEYPFNNNNNNNNAADDDGDGGGGGLGFDAMQSCRWMPAF
jgi:hypothetical protein